MFQSSFELTGYITYEEMHISFDDDRFQSSFELTGYITSMYHCKKCPAHGGFKALSSLRVI